jgi:hypothetical protein
MGPIIYTSSMLFGEAIYDFQGVPYYILPKFAGKLLKDGVDNGPNIYKDTKP